MTQSIINSLKIQFQEELMTRAQQTKSRFRGKVKEIPVSGKQHAVDRIDQVDALEITSRHADTVAQDIEHSRRELAMREFRATILLDDFDALTSIVDPTRDYAASVMRSLMRQYDKVMYDAAFADVRTGRNFGTTVTFANDDGATVAAGGTGLTYEKLLEVRENFASQGYGDDMNDELFVAMTPTQMSDLLAENELTSGDFVRDYAIEGGKIAKALGMTFFEVPNAQFPIISKTGSNREVVAFAKSALCAGVAKDISVKISERPDKNHAYQVQACLYMGGVRADGRGVQKIEAVEA